MTSALITTLKSNDFILSTFNTSLSKNPKSVNKFSIYKVFLMIRVLLSLLKIRTADFYFVVLNWNWLNSPKLLVALFKIYFCKKKDSKIYVWPHLRIEKFSSTITNIIRKMNIEIICLGKIEAAKYKDLGFKVKIIENFVPANRPSIKTNRTCKNILFFSNLYKFKGIVDFIECINKFYNKYDFNVTVMGRDADLTSDDIFQMLKNLSKQNRLSVYNNISGYEKYEIIKNCDILIYPSINDYSPLTVLECLKMNLPVIAYEIGELKYMIKNQGKVVKNKNELFDVFEKWLNNKTNFVVNNNSNYTIKNFEEKILNLIR